MTVHEEIDRKAREEEEAQQKETEKAEKAAASANKAKDAAEAEMAFEAGCSVVSVDSGVVCHQPAGCGQEDRQSCWIP